MRKVLLGTTAFVAASVVASGASAQSLEDRIRTLEESMLMGSPGSGFDVGVSGYMHGGFFLVDIDDNPATTAEEDYGSTDVKIGATEIHFTATGQLDNGIEVGGRVELEGTTQTDQIDETYIWAEGGFGRMVIGAENGPSYLMHYSAPWIAGVNGVDSPNYRYTTHGGAARTNTQTLIASDANKITYFTPRFSGFQFGIAYTPSATGDNRGGEQNGWGSAYDRSGGTGVENIVAVAGNFSRDFGGVSVGASAGWESGSSNVTYDNGTDNPQSVSDDPTNWHIGGEVSRGGFTVGGAYYSATGFTGGDGTGDATSTVGEGQTNEREVDLTSDTEQTAWAVGAHYATGPWG
ncbi:MAG: porin, partial [Hyphomicrobiales bacterium]|nr:porin [Hyphomicrobiales bacterium]